MVGAIPYPLTASESASVVDTDRVPFYGHKSGNFQPTTNLTDTVNPGNHQTGGRVQNAADARFDNSNVHDGIGDGVDAYVMYKGNGGIAAGWPTRAKWVSFENM